MHPPITKIGYHYSKMNYKEFYFPLLGVKAEITGFHPQRKIVEYHAMLHVAGDNSNYETQLANLHKVFQELMVKEFLIGTVPVFKRYFLSDAANQAMALKKELETFPPCAVSIVQQPPLDGSKIALWVYLMSNVTVEAGDLFTVSHNDYRHHWLAGKGISAENSETQTSELLENYETMLANVHCNIADNCIRTWFFVQNVDVNYGGVVKARRENFREQGLTEQTHYIASTGIEGRDANPAIFVLMDAYAVGGLTKEQIRYLYALTHLSPTYEYGVTFERGVCMEYGDRKHLYISGTASIDGKGEVLHAGDVRAQTRRVWDNVEKLLEEGEAAFCDVMQMIVYLRDISDYPIVKQMFEERFPEIPKQHVLAPVCRPSWLVEMECIAAKANNNSAFNDL
ncbi:putative aminoacrylate peracid reductase RutC [termite gut metagenome]|uniref:Putative aminoacrylate peracid reductase RutC n=1 Tax=termite gut metagenome TaxID=433724 RepID=A0A5J4QF02_9ZZZZ